MVGFERHVLVCTNQRGPDNPRGCCSSKGSEEVLARLKAGLAERGLKGRMRVNASGCLDHCEHGTTLVVYPEAVWYGGVTPDDCEELFREHVLNGRPVERLRLGRATTAE